MLHLDPPKNNVNHQGNYSAQIVLLKKSEHNYFSTEIYKKKKNKKQNDYIKALCNSSLS